MKLKSTLNINKIEPNETSSMFESSETQQKIRIFDLQFTPEFKSAFLNSVSEILDQAYLTNHIYVKKFEEQFAKSLNATNGSCMLSNGTSALEVAFRLFNLKNKNVVVPTNTFIATAAAVMLAGAKPLLVDVNSYGQLSFDHLKTFDPSQVGAVCVVHIGGIIQKDIEEIANWCETYSIPLIEDCAHAHGSSFKGVSAGLIGDIGAYSFHLTKTITCGEGGALVSKHTEVMKKSYSLRQFGKTSYDELLFEELSGNHKMTELQALLGLMDLERSKERIRRRQHIHNIYLQRLTADENLKKIFHVLSPDLSTECGHYKTIITSGFDRRSIETYLNKNGVPLTGGVYNNPLHKQPLLFEHWQHTSFTGADWFSQHHFCPPCYPELTDIQVDYICDQLITFSKESVI